MTVFPVTKIQDQTLTYHPRTSHSLYSEPEDRCKYYFTRLHLVSKRIFADPAKFVKAKLGQRGCKTPEGAMII